LKRAHAASDEMQQGIRDIEFLDDPTSGEVRMGCPEAIAAILPPILEEYFRQFPRTLLHVAQMGTRPDELSALHDRNCDFILGFLPLPHSTVGGSYNVEFLYDEELVVAAGIETRWARRRRIDLAELVDEPWTLTEPGTWNHRSIAEAFHKRDLAMPTINL